MYKEIEFEGSEGKIHGIAYFPSKNPCPVVVVCHSLTSKADTSYHKSLAKSLCESEFGLFAFDFNGHGESYGEFQDFTLTKGLYDLNSALDYIEKIEQADNDKIGVYGSSMGGTIALIQAARDKRIKKLVLRAPISNLNETMPKLLGDISTMEKTRYAFVSRPKDKRRLNYEFYKDIMRYDIYCEAKNVYQPVLIIQGDEDDMVLKEHSEELLKSLKKGEIEIIKGANHVLTKPSHIKILRQLTVEWFNDF
jgi:hypothetical protein